MPRSFPFEGEVPVVPIKVIQWAEVLNMVSSPVEESIASKVTTVVTQDDFDGRVDDVEIYDRVLSADEIKAQYDVVDPLGDEDEADVSEDEKVWMGNDLPYKEGSEEPHEPIDLQAFAKSLEADQEDSDESDN